MRFTNAEQEWPIGEFAAYYVHSGELSPLGVTPLCGYNPQQPAPLADNPSLTPLVDYIRGRFPADQRATMVRRRQGPLPVRRPRRLHLLPIVHILIPA